MSRAEQILIYTLRVCAALLLVALIPAFMPFSWMVAIHEWLGLGELPERPIVGYLARSCSLLYAFHGGLILYLSFDLQRYLPLVRCLAALSILFGVGIAIVDWTANLPLAWIVCESSMVFALGILLWYLAGRAGARSG